jgi:phosphoglycolate phosphatase
MDAVLFDFDLTLADSTQPIADCVNHALQALGRPCVAPESVRRLIGLPRARMFRELTGGGDPELEARFSHHFAERADVVMAEQTRIYDCVAPTLAALRSRSVRVGIVSMKFRYRIEEVLRRAQLSDAVDLIVGAEDVTRQKPDPEGLLLGLARLGISCSRALYVGDHLLDAEAAKRAGMHFVGVRTGATDEAAWSSCTRLGVINDVAGVVDYLRPV